MMWAMSMVVAMAMAVPASPEMFTVTQSDGSELKVRLVGDEVSSCLFTEDEYAVAKTGQGYCYLRFTEQGEALATQVLAHNPALRSLEETLFLASLQKGMIVSDRTMEQRRIVQKAQLSSTFPLKGSPRSLVILVNFSDVKFVIPDPQEAFSRLLNEEGYSENNGVGSARDYFKACSNGVFSPQFDVYGPYDLDQTCAYYGGNSGSNSSVHAREMIIHACNKAYEAGVDLSLYDTDGNGVVDNVFVYYAGHNEAEGADENTVWPHRSVVNNSPRYGNVTVYDYACTSELRSSRGSQMCGIGTFCHEFGHVLGLPDFYDTQESYHYTVGNWSIMCSGSYNGNGKTPPAYTAYERFMLGWLSPVQLTEAGRYTLSPLNLDNTAYLIAAESHNLSGNNPDPNEFFLLENRQHIGWDTPQTALAGTGMLIWHINYNASAWANNTPNTGTMLRYYVEAAHGGTQSMSLPSDLFPGTLGVVQFSPQLSDGTILSPLLDIKEIGSDISFVYKNDGQQKFLFFPAELNGFLSYYDRDRRSATPDVQRIVLQGMSLKPGENVSLSSKDGFQLSVDSVAWYSSLALSVKADSALEQAVWVRYNPQAVVCEAVNSTLTARQGNNMEILQVSGTSERPTYIQEPQWRTFTGVTPYSAVLNWVPQPDAEEYYLTVYELENRQNTQVQSFERFASEVNIVEEGWSSNFARVTSTAHSDGTYALWFRETDEQVTSVTYVQPVTSLSLWYNALSSDDDAVGVLRVGAFNGEEWKDVSEIEVYRTSRKQTYSETFSEEDNYVAFRITYESLGGTGVAVDAFSATCSKEPVYLYKGRDCTVKSVNIDGVAPEDYTCFYLGGLEPDKQYYCQIQCGETKGCTEHLTAVSAPVLLRTLKGEPADSRNLTVAVDSIRYDSPTHVVYVPEADKSRELGFYDLQGHLVYSLGLLPQQNTVELPVERFIRGNVYIMKYHVAGTMKRKDKSAKIVF